MSSEAKPNNKLLWIIIASFIIIVAIVLFVILQNRKLQIGFNEEDIKLIQILESNQELAKLIEFSKTQNTDGKIALYSGLLSNNSKEKRFPENYYSQLNGLPNTFLPLLIDPLVYFQNPKISDKAKTNFIIAGKDDLLQFGFLVSHARTENASLNAITKTILEASKKGTYIQISPKSYDVQDTISVYEGGDYRYLPLFYDQYKNVMSQPNQAKFIAIGGNPTQGNILACKLLGISWNHSLDKDLEKRLMNILAGKELQEQIRALGIGLSLDTSLTLRDAIELDTKKAIFASNALFAISPPISQELKEFGRQLVENSKEVETYLSQHKEALSKIIELH